MNDPTPIIIIQKTNIENLYPVNMQTYKNRKELEEQLFLFLPFIPPKIDA